MARYKNTQTKIKNGKEYYQTTIYEKAPDRDSDLYFLAQEGDRCDNLANRFYDPSESSNVVGILKDVPAGMLFVFKLFTLAINHHNEGSP